MVVKSIRRGGQGRHDDGNKKGWHDVFFRTDLQDSGILFPTDWQIARKLGRTSAESSQDVVQGRPNFSGAKTYRGQMKCRRMVAHVYSVFIFGCETWSWSQQATDRAKGRETHGMSIKFSCQKRGRRNVVRVAHESGKIGKEHLTVSPFAGALGGTIGQRRGTKGQHGPQHGKHSRGAFGNV